MYNTNAIFIYQSSIQSILTVIVDHFIVMSCFLQIEEAWRKSLSLFFSLLNINHIQFSTVRSYTYLKCALDFVKAGRQVWNLTDTQFTETYGVIFTSPWIRAIQANYGRQSSLFLLILSALLIILLE